MLFSSAVFLFAFLPIVLFVYYVIFRKSRNLQNIFLLIASLIFYAWGEPKFVFIMLLSIFANWLLGIVIDKKRDNKNISRLIVALSAVFNVGMIFIFKYLMFTVVTLNSIFKAGFNVPEIALPIGISFFTFQAFSYVIDVYRGNGEVQKNPLNVGLYIAFFPQLIAGPIVRYQTVAYEIKNRRETWEDFTSGITRFIVGFIKKVVIANTMAVIADTTFDSENNLSVSFAWLGAIAYTLQIYFDFSGYSDMGIGLGKMFGFHFLENFDYPYCSKSITEFWRRWHISLGSWFRDYVYIPLGGSRVKKPRLIFNLFAVWLLTGIWHGANWTFILWGIMYFVLISFEKLFNFEKRWQRLKGIKYIYTMLFVVLGWVLFRAESVSSAMDYLKMMFGLNGNQFLSIDTVFYLKNNIVLFIVAVVFSFPIIPFIKSKIETKPSKIKLPCEIIGVVLIMILFVIAVSYMVKGVYNPFIYFNF